MSYFESREFDFPLQNWSQYGFVTKQHSAKSTKGRTLTQEEQQVSTRQQVMCTVLVFVYFLEALHFKTKLVPFPYQQTQNHQLCFCCNRRPLYFLTSALGVSFSSPLNNLTVFEAWWCSIKSVLCKKSLMEFQSPYLYNYRQTTMNFWVYDHDLAFDQKNCPILPFISKKSMKGKLLSSFSKANKSLWGPVAHLCFAVFSHIYWMRAGI